MSDVENTVNTLKSLLKGKGITYLELGNLLGISEAGIKKMFKDKNLTLKRLEEICGAIGTTMAEVINLAQQRSQAPVTYLTNEQEEALSLDSELLTIFYLLLNRWSVNDISRKVGLKANLLTNRLMELDRLKLIEVHPKNRIKLLTVPNIKWNRNGPIQSRYENLAITEFLSPRFSGSASEFNFYFYQFSDVSIRHIKKKMERLMMDINTCAEADASLPPSYKRDMGILLALRPWLFSVLGTSSINRDTQELESYEEK